MTVNCNFSPFLRPNSVQYLHNFSPTLNTSNCVACYMYLKFDFSCEGGYPEQAVEWVAKNRIVSGGNYSSSAFCMPYPFPPKCEGK